MQCAVMAKNLGKFPLALAIRPFNPSVTASWTTVGSLRTASSETSMASRRRLKFDATQPLTVKESVRVAQSRETKKREMRQQAMQDEARPIASFRDVLNQHDKWPLQRAPITTFQVNIGKLCNLTCQHCHVESGPTKVVENMNYETVRRCLEIIESSPSIQIVDITGGAPELNPHFKMLVSEARAMGKAIIDRCNLVVFFEKGQEELPKFLADNQVRVVASLPCYTDANTTSQRGKRVFPDSIAALRMLNALGYGQTGSPLILDLVYNPVGPSLPGNQSELEADYRRVLREDHGVEFSSLIAIANMPIKRFADHLLAQGRLGEYMALLADSFNQATVDGLMCRNTINVAWNGQIFDCDFNAALEMGIRGKGGDALDIWRIDKVSDIADEPVRTGKHCFGCTAGSGSSCTGALAA